MACRTLRFWNTVDRRGNRHDDRARVLLLHLVEVVGQDDDLVQVPGGELGVLLVGVKDHRDVDGIDVRLARLEPVRVLGQHELHVGRVALERERPAADHHLCRVVAARQRLARKDPGVDRRGQCFVERRVRIVQLEDDRVRIRRLDLVLVEHAQRALAGVGGQCEGTHERGLDVLGLDGVAVDGRDVLELGVRPQLDRPGDRIRRFGAHGQVRLRLDVVD
jgi:hypothetical protein